MPFLDIVVEWYKKHITPPVKSVSRCTGWNCVKVGLGLLFKLTVSSKRWFEINQVLKNELKFYVWLYYAKLLVPTFGYPYDSYRHKLHKYRLEYIENIIYISYLIYLNYHNFTCPAEVLLEWELLVLNMHCELCDHCDSVTADVLAPNGAKPSVGTMCSAKFDMVS